MNINATLVGQMIAFAVFVWFCMKYIWPPVLQVLDERQKKIADGLAASQQATHDLELAQARIAKDLDDARVQAQEIIDQAGRRAGQIVDEAKDAARKEGERLIQAAKAEIAQQVSQAKDGLRLELAGLATAGASKIIGRHLDEEANKDLVNDLIDELRESA